MSTLTFSPRDFKGSRFRCLLLTHQTRPEVAKALTDLVTPHATVSDTDKWAPSGFYHPQEARLEQSGDFVLNSTTRHLLKKWWLVNGGNTPNWDLVSTCQIEGKQGLILVEAKAHEGELSNTGGGSDDPGNQRQIDSALAEATTGWNTLEPGFALSSKSHYQLSNRLAFAWKLAQWEIPVVLVYLGFLNAEEMKPGVPFTNAAHWDACLLRKGKGIVPNAVWGKTYYVAGTPLTVLSRTL